MFVTKPRHRVTVLAIGLIGSAGAQAITPSDDAIATIGEITGTVLVDDGQTFLQAQAGEPLTAHDRIFVLKGGSASLTFRDGCQASVVGPASRAFGPDTSCDSLRAATADSLEQVAADAASSPQATALERAGTSQWTDSQIGLGILGTGALAGVIWAATDDDDDKPARQQQLSP